MGGTTGRAVASYSVRSKDSDSNSTGCGMVHLVSAAGVKGYGPRKRITLLKPFTFLAHHKPHSTKMVQVLFRCCRINRPQPPSFSR